ncbi:MAG TPA: hypothetical protein VGN74_05400 [Brevundimonas sp.]|jgi:hypothetical protein|uniref:hypothetical protein n=1 Tax=Brevundimonas sp. TaxID=1871086 RepID=UPI002E0D6AB5|nr:hypothetical protein [Brevundimonas sp.]
MTDKLEDWRRLERERELLGDDINGGFIRDLCFTVWNKARYGYGGEPGDWANDTLPTVQEGIRRIREMVSALTPHAPAQAEIDRLQAELDQQTAEAASWCIKAQDAQAEIDRLRRALEWIKDGGSWQGDTAADALAPPDTLKDTPHD